MLRTRLRCRPNVVCLESRDVPTLVIWTGGSGSQLWSDAGNWDKMKVPMDGDDVIVNDSKTVFFTSNAGSSLINTLMCTAPFSIDGGFLSVSTSGSFSTTVSQSGGVIGGAGSLSFAGPVTSSAGAMVGQGKTDFNSSWAVNTTGVSFTMTGRDFNINSSFNWSGTADLLTGDGNFNVGSMANASISATANWTKSAGGFTRATPINLATLSKLTADGAQVQFQGPVNAASQSTITVNGSLLTFFWWRPMERGRRRHGQHDHFWRHGHADECQHPNEWTAHADEWDN